MPTLIRAVHGAHLSGALRASHFVPDKMVLSIQDKFVWNEFGHAKHARRAKARDGLRQSRSLKLRSSERKILSLNISRVHNPINLHVLI